MSFETFAGAQSVFLWSAFILAFIMGVVVNKTNFCTMGAVSDMVNMGDFSRFRAWLLAIAVAMLAVIVLEPMGLADANGAFPPYRSGQLIWAENILGGLLFGIGMTYGSGCGNKTLIRIGAGNIKSILVFFLIGVIAYFMLNPFPDSDQTLMSLLFYDWIRPLAVNVGASQDLGTLVAKDNGETARMIIGGGIVLGLLIYIFKSADFRSSFDNILGGLVVGLAVAAAWYVSSSISIDVPDEGSYLLGQYYEEWDMLAESEEGKPATGAPLRPQSFTFINPLGQTVGYASAGFDKLLLTFGIMAVFGVIAGSFVWSLVSRSFRFEWFASFRDFVNHVIGGVLMGFGGTLALGCTVGQGITGVSTLALGSFLALFAIIFGCAITMKVQLYKMVYDDASFFSALMTGLADMKLLPAALRKHDAV